MPTHEQQRQIAVGHGQQAAEQHRLDLVDVELPRQRDQQAQAEAERQRVKDADQRVGRQRRVPLDVDHRPASTAGRSRTSRRTAR